MQNPGGQQDSGLGSNPSQGTPANSGQPQGGPGYGFNGNPGNPQGGAFGPQGFGTPGPNPGYGMPNPGEQNMGYGAPDGAGPQQGDNWWNDDGSGIPEQNTDFWRQENGMENGPQQNGAEPGNGDGQDQNDRNRPQGPVGRFSNTVLPPSDQMK